MWLYSNRLVSLWDVRTNQGAWRHQMKLSNASSNFLPAINGMSASLQTKFPWTFLHFHHRIIVADSLVVLCRKYIYRSSTLRYIQPDDSPRTIINWYMHFDGHNASRGVRKNKTKNSSINGSQKKKCSRLSEVIVWKF